MYSALVLIGNTKMNIKRPIAWLAICAIAGTWFGFSLDIPSLWLLVGFIFFFCLAGLAGLTRIKVLSKNSFRLLFMISIATVVLIGFWLSAVLYIQRNDLSVLKSVANIDTAEVNVVGMVAGDPFIYKNRYGHGWIWKFPLRLKKLQINNVPNEKESCSGVITVKWYGPPPGNERIYGNSKGTAPEYGEQWQMTGKIRLSKYSKRKENYVLISGRRSSQKISANITSGMARQCLAARRSAATKLSVGIEDFPESVALLRAILLGYRSDLKGEMRDLFASVGTLHIFAISGLHVGIVCSLIIFVLSVLTIPRTHWVLLLAPLLIAYTFATGARPSAIRACIMAIIYFGAPLVWRKADSISTVSLAAILILTIAPQQLFQIGFIYSFVVVLGLILLFPVIHHALRNLMQRLHIFNRVGESTVAPLFWEQDDFQIQEESWWIKLIRKFIHNIISLFALSCSAWLASIPITAYFFGRVSPIALIGNVLVIPLAFLVVVTGALSLVLGYCMTILADIFNHANLLTIYILVNTMKILAKIPGAFFEIEKVPLWFVYVWYAVLLGIVYGYKRKSNLSNTIDN